MDCLGNLCDALARKSPGLERDIRLSTIAQFIRLAVALKPTILHSQDVSFDPTHIPQVLNGEIQRYLAEQLAVPVATVDSLWEAFRIVVWVDDGNGDGAASVLDGESLPRMHGKLEDKFRLGTSHISL